MRTLIIQPGIIACQVEVPEDIERSREGSLHIRPGSTIIITDDELAYLCEARPDLVDKATLVGGTLKQSPKPAPKEPAPVSSGSETPKGKDKDEPETPKDDKPKTDGGKKAKSKGK